jgi:hypothetical protein
MGKTAWSWDDVGVKPKPKPPAQARRPAPAAPVVATPDPRVAELEAENARLSELVRAHETRIEAPRLRWDVVREPNADVLVCRGEHEKAEGCDYERWVPIARVDEARAEADRLRALLIERQAEIDALRETAGVDRLVLPETLAWLREVAKGRAMAPAALAGAVLDDVAKDDRAAHGKGVQGDA